MSKFIPGLPEPKKDFCGIAERTMPNKYTKFSEKIAFNYGYKEAIILGILINKHDQEDRYHQLPPDGSFSISINNIYKRSGINRKTIYKIIDILAGHGFLEYTPGEKGEPYSRRYYRLNEDIIKLAAGGMDPMELVEVCKNGLSQKGDTPLSQKGDTPIVKTDHPYGKNGIGGYGKIGTIYRSNIEANIEAVDKREKGADHFVEHSNAVEMETTTQQQEFKTDDNKFETGPDPAAEIKTDDIELDGGCDPAASNSLQNYDLVGNINRLLAESGHTLPLHARNMPDNS